MDEIRVMITGLVLLVNQAMYKTNGSGDIGGALAIRVPAGSSSAHYGVEIPPHDTYLILVDGQIKKTEGYDTKRRELTEIPLDGDRIAFGQYLISQQGGPKSNDCQIFSRDGAGAEPADSSSRSLRHIPRMSRILTDEFTLREDARPQEKSYAAMGRATAPVSAWMDLSGGRLFVPSKLADNKPHVMPVLDFRPSDHEQAAAEEVVWVREIEEGHAACVAIQPFGDPGLPAAVIFFEPGGAVGLQFTNAMDESKATEAHSAIGYDFEMYYKALDKPPQIPPLPHAVGIRFSGHENSSPVHPNAHGTSTSALTGVRCGPPVRLK